MKPIENLVRDNVKNLKPCVHGAEVLGAAEESGLKPHEILDFSSSVNPWGHQKRHLRRQKKPSAKLQLIPIQTLMN